MQIHFSIRGAHELTDWLKEVQKGVITAALNAFTEYVIGNESHGLKHPDPYRYVTREAAYGKTFQSDAQRSYVMTRIRSGEITPGRSQRTGESEAAWQYVQETPNRNVIQNPSVGAYYTRDDMEQAAQPAMVGWRKSLRVIYDNYQGGLRAAGFAVQQFLNSRKK